MSAAEVGGKRGPRRDRQVRRSKKGLWPLRFLSLAIAVTLWLVYSYSGREQSRVERTFEVAVTYTIPRGLLVLNPISSVSVRLSGSASVMNPLTPFQLGLSANVIADTGLQEVILDADSVSRPDDVDVVSITPPRLSIEVDEEMRKQLRVVVDPGGSEVSGGAVWLGEQTTVRPEFLTFSGPKSLLQTRDRVMAPIDLQGHFESFRQQVVIDPIHELVQPLGPSFVEINVVIEGPELPGDTGTNDTDTGGTGTS